MTESGYWQGMVLCRRKGFCHMTREQCLATHDLNACGDCSHFMNFLQEQERAEWDEAMQVEEDRLIKTSKRKKGGGK
jgi:hypothetical protein